MCLDSALHRARPSLRASLLVAVEPRVPLCTVQDRPRDKINKPKQRKQRSEHSNQHRPARGRSQTKRPSGMHIDWYTSPAAMRWDVHATNDCNINQQKRQQRMKETWVQQGLELNLASNLTLDGGLLLSVASRGMQELGQPAEVCCNSARVEY